MTLPLIKPVVWILTITKTIWALQTYDLVYILTADGPAGGTELRTYYIHKNTFKYLDFGYGSDFILTGTAGVLASIPPVLLALVFQRHIISGLSAGAVKGWRT